MIEDRLSFNTLVSKLIFGLIRTAALIICGSWLVCEHADWAQVDVPSFLCVIERRLRLVLMSLLYTSCRWGWHLKQTCTGLRLTAVVNNQRISSDAASTQNSTKNITLKMLLNESTTPITEICTEFVQFLRIFKNVWLIICVFFEQTCIFYLSIKRNEEQMISAAFYGFILQTKKKKMSCFCRFIVREKQDQTLLNVLLVSIIKAGMWRGVEQRSTHQTSSADRICYRFEREQLIRSCFI